MFSLISFIHIQLRLRRIKYFKGFLLSILIKLTTISNPIKYGFKCQLYA